MMTDRGGATFFRLPSLFALCRRNSKGPTSSHFGDFEGLVP
jgi:hypothetical protein